MGIQAWFRDLFTSSNGEAEAAPVREAARSVNIDPDDDQWRRLTGSVNRDISPLSQTRMQELAVHLWDENPIANRLIELPLSYMLAEGVGITSEDEEAQAWIDAFWTDPINCMEVKLPKRARELALYGEQCWPVFVNDSNGDVRLGYLDPGLIETIVVDPENAEQPIGIVTRRNSRGVARRYRIIVNGPEDVFTERTRQIRETFSDGDCFYFKVNDLCSGRRGRSDLRTQFDWLDGYDQALFGELDRWDFQRAFVWDVKMSGATPEEVDARARAITVPRPGSVKVHNEHEEWNAVTPELGSADTEKFARLFRNHIIGGSSMPEHWYGGGGDVNRSTAGSMTEPTFKTFSARQTQIGHMLVEVLTFVIRMKLHAYYGVEPSQEELQERRPTVVWPEMTAKDTTAYAAALAQVVHGALAAIDAGLLSEETAVELIASVGERLGVTIDSATELAAARQRSSKRAADDAFGGMPQAAPDDA
jgi:hypothetical protein